MKGMAARRAGATCAVVALLTMSLVAPAIAGPGPAPNSGDGVSDGSGFETTRSVGQGGAPNSGDGIPDGSGF